MSYCWDAFVSFMFKIPLSNSFFGVIPKENEFPNCFPIVELLKYWDVFCIFLLFIDIFQIYCWIFKLKKIKVWNDIWKNH